MFTHQGNQMIETSVLETERNKSEFLNLFREFKSNALVSKVPELCDKVQPLNIKTAFPPVVTK